MILRYVMAGKVRNFAAENLYCEVSKPDNGITVVAIPKPDADKALLVDRGNYIKITVEIDTEST